jgi:hypothetical protein
MGTENYCSAPSLEDAAAQEHRAPCRSQYSERAASFPGGRNSASAFLNNVQG